ncbi:hypothetical protein [Sphingobium sp.]|uniref:hypothetical protein n=1 Tax=Sphingobium sp. TaxID=1912891 RepID=UPI002C6F56A7|nr:hypothetical protein [Sphingobium sp.]HUD91007.1 hypothetical protein [Sphingobium sp.]
MAKFIVHIGDGKCGSSAIQAALFDAQATLHQAGLAYTSHHRTSGNFCMGTLLGKSTRGNDVHQKAFARQTIAQLQAQLSTSDYIVISSEAFLTLGPEQVVTILQMITPDIERIDVIAYVRDPLGMYLSLAQQAIKASYRFPRPDTYARPLDQLLGQWQSCPKIDSVTVRIFDRKKLIGTNVVADVEQVLKTLTGKQGFHLEQINENSSLSAEQMVALQDYRRRFCHEIDGKSAPRSSRLIDFFTTMNEAGLVGTKPQLSPAAATLIVQGNADIIQRLNDRYGFTMECRAALSDEIPQNNNWAHISSILSEVRSDYVHHLKMLVPGFNPALENGNMEKALRSMHKLIEMEPKKKDAIERAATVYWNTEAIAGITSS